MHSGGFDSLCAYALLPCDLPKETERVPFGRNMTLNFLTVCILKYRGAEVVDKLVTDIPEEVKETAKRLDLTFCERCTSVHLHKLPEGNPRNLS